jgi:hypothetical protein
MVQRYMCISTRQTREKWSHQSAKCDEGITPKCAEEKIEPNYIRFDLPESVHQTQSACRIVERPAPLYRESVEFLPMICRKLIGEHCEAQEWIALEFLSDMKPVLA